MNLPISSSEAELVIPELIMLFGLIGIILIPNLGNASFRIPLLEFMCQCLSEVVASKVRVILNYLIKFH